MFGIVGAAVHTTHRQVGRDYGQYIDVGVETGRIGGCHRGGTRVGGHIAVPVGEVVASSRRCSYGGGASAQGGSLNAGTRCCGLWISIAVGVGNLHRAALALALSHGCAHHIVVDAEEGFGGGVARHGEGERRKSGEFVRGVRHRVIAIGGGGECMLQLVLPAADEIQRVGRGLHRHVGVVIHNVFICSVAIHHAVREICGGSSNNGGYTS